jgi:drug/metabolite transporter (DMT)-like permease
VKPKTRAELALVAATFVWGATFPIVKIGMEFVSPVLMVAIRFVVATVVLLLFFHRQIFPIPRAAIIKGGILSLFLFLGFVAQNIGLTITTASKSSFITGMMVIFVPLFQVVIERRMPKIGNIVGVVIVATGLWFLTSPVGEGLNSGDALTLLCSVLFGVYIVYLDVVSKEMTAMQLVFLQMLCTAVYALLATLAFETPVFHWSGEGVAALVYLTFMATLATTYVQTRFQKDTTPTRAVVIFSIEPVVASVAAAFILGEKLGALGMVGGALIITGVLVSELSDSIPLLNRSLDRTGDRPGDDNPSGGGDS